MSKSHSWIDVCACVFTVDMCVCVSVGGLGSGLHLGHLIGPLAQEPGEMLIG